MTRIGWSSRRAVLAAGLTATLAPRIVLARSGIDRQYRILLDEDFLWLDKRGADRLIATARATGFNTIMPCVWHGRGVTWASELPRERYWEKNLDAGKDPLGYLVAAAHAAGLEVHPWFTVTLRQRDFFRAYWDDGTPKDSFDIHRPEFRAFITEVILEVVRRYPVDGVNLDYIRSRGVCTSPACREDYRRRTGENLLADAAITRLSEGARERIIAWNSAAMAALVEQISGAVRSARPGLPISISAHAGVEGFRIEGVDSIGWVNRQWVDWLLHMEYAKPADMRVGLMEGARAKLREPWRMIVIAGNYEKNPLDRDDVWSRDPALVAEAVRTGLGVNREGRGVALYSYRFLNREQQAALAPVLAKAGLEQQ